MSWECRHKSGDHCNRLDVECDPGRTGCVLHGRFYFPFAPEKNTKAMNDAAAGTGRPAETGRGGERRSHSEADRPAEADSSAETDHRRASDSNDS